MQNPSEIKPTTPYETWPKEITWVSSLLIGKEVCRRRIPQYVTTIENKNTWETHSIYPNKGTEHREYDPHVYIHKNVSKYDILYSIKATNYQSRIYINYSHNQIQIHIL